MKKNVKTYNSNNNIIEDTIEINAKKSIHIGNLANVEAKDEFLLSFGNLTSEAKHDISHVTWWKALDQMVITGNDSNLGEALFIDCKNVLLEADLSATDIYIMKDTDFHNSASHLHGDIHYVGSAFEMYEIFNSYFI